MSADGTTLSYKNVLLPSSVMEGGKHYTAGVFWTKPQAPVEPSAILRELENLNIHGFLNSKTDNWFWLVIEPEHDVPTGQLVLLGKRFDALFGVWDYTPEPEMAMDFREWLQSVQETTAEISNFISEHWLLIVLSLLGLLVLFVVLVLRR